jgi:hypothetical protein
MCILPSRFGPTVSGKDKVMLWVIDHDRLLMLLLVLTGLALSGWTANQKGCFDEGTVSMAKCLNGTASSGSTVSYVQPLRCFEVETPSHLRFCTDDTGKYIQQ